MSKSRKQLGLFLGPTIVVLLATNMPWLRMAHSEEDRAVRRDLGEIKTETVSRLPSRNRTTFGIGEHVYCWIERPAKEPHKVVPGEELSDFVVWTVTDYSIMLPTITRIGDRSILHVGLSDHDSQLNIAVAHLDSIKAVAKGQDWQPAAPTSEKVQPRPANAVDKTSDDSASESAGWKKKLYRLINLRQPKKTRFDEVERLAGEILSEPLSDKDTAQVYFQLAELYAQTGMSHPERVLEYSRRALALPLEPHERTTLAIYRGDASLARPSQQTFLERCRVATIEYQAGQLEIARHDLPAEPRERKMSVRYDGHEFGPDGKEPKVVTEMREIQKFNARVDFEARLIEHREIIGQQLKTLARFEN